MGFTIVFQHWLKQGAIYIYIFYKHLFSFYHSWGTMLHFWCKVLQSLFNRDMKPSEACRSVWVAEKGQNLTTKSWVMIRKQNKESKKTTRWKERQQKATKEQPEEEEKHEGEEQHEEEEQHEKGRTAWTGRTGWWGRHEDVKRTKRKWWQSVFLDRWERNTATKRNKHGRLCFVETGERETLQGNGTSMEDSIFRQVRQKHCNKTEQTDREGKPIDCF